MFCAQTTLNGRSFVKMSALNNAVSEGNFENISQDRRAIKQGLNGV